MSKKKKVLIVVGTRPNFIKITQFEKEFALYPDHFEYKLVHTGQHFDDNMSKVFFRQLELKTPDFYLNIEDRNPARQIGYIIIELEGILSNYQPDLVIVVGDVNSTLAAAIAANKFGCKIAHLESGLRSYDRTMPEEHNRLVADALADYYTVTEQSGLDNLLGEGKQREQIFFVGNTMIDTLVAFNTQIAASDIMQKLQLQKGKFILMTMHRPANVDTKESLDKLVNLVNTLSSDLKLVFPIHPRTTQKLKDFGLWDDLTQNPAFVFTEPLDYFAFQNLISNCFMVLTDSGGIQEETTFCQVPCLTLRPNTERPSTIELGTNILVDYDLDIIFNYIKEIENGTFKKGHIPPFWDGFATKRIVEHFKEMEF